MKTALMFLKVFLSLIFIGEALALAASSAKRETLEDLSRDAYVWGYPAVLMKQTRQAMLPETKNSLNHFFHSKNAHENTLKTIAPNNSENIYSWAWLDLSSGPVVLLQPEINDRYYAVHLVDAYANVLPAFSSNSLKTNKAMYVLTGPGWQGPLPDGALQVTVTTNEVFLLAQTFLKDPSELNSLAKMMTKYQLIPLSEWNKGQRIENRIDSVASTTIVLEKNLASLGSQFFLELQQVLAKNPSAKNAAPVHRFESLGLAEKISPSKNKFDADSLGMIERGLYQGEREIEARVAVGFRPKVNGWVYGMKTQDLEEDSLLKASVAKTQLFSLPPDEMVQLTVDTDSEARQLNSAYNYALHFDKGDLPSNRHTWSLRAFDSLSKKVSTPLPHLAQASISDRSRYLKYNADGSLDIKIQQGPPEKDERGNWLALSKNANFYVVLTIYNPSKLVLNRKYIAPSLTRVEEGLPKQKIVRTMMAQSTQNP